MTISTHVLDTSRGRPAGGVTVRLDLRLNGDWSTVDEGRTDADGRLSGWTVHRAGEYRLVFGVGDYLGPDAFYPEVTVAFRIADPKEHYHVPLLISPFGYSTYRGS
ncbi:MAG TPA: hydroxyisourate hydrolase [Actinophytocola sp.]|uniref:hydroxyisourate hydrolase n=1 Tax=Actinophytocola sp. TaxID=1872138 RepID=UPI002DB94BBA|nr:hydroxyisourate hydrolase [Actinophytocola sp.]HEU5476023.1 hydroxyisourate hydrolase [Actinophytocola sp.]